MDVYFKFLLLVVIHIQTSCYSSPFDTIVHQQTLPGAGLSFDKCTTHDDCAGTRICEGPESNSTSCIADGRDCRCYPNRNECRSNRDCDDGEVCVKQDFLVCISRTAIAKNPLLSLLGRFHSEREITESLGASDNIEGGDNATTLGLNFDGCSDHTDCAGSRICHGSSESVSCALDDNGCFCYPNFDRCKSSEDCEEGELCVKGSSYGYLLCISINALQEFPMLTPVEENEIQGTTPPTNTSSELGKGLNFDWCSNEGDCKGSRGCHGPYPKSVSCPADALDCACYPNWDECVTSVDCDDGEVCVNGSTSGSLRCISMNALTDFPMLASTDEGSLRLKVMVSPSPSTQKETGGKESNLGLNFDKCSPVKKCSGRRECIELGIQKNPCIGEAKNCRCYPGNHRCLNDADCDEGEVCKIFIRTERNVCTSEDAAVDYALFKDLETKDKFTVIYTTEEPEQVAPAVSISGSNDRNTGPNRNACIDSKALDHFNANELVFKEHKIASVLCDHVGSCATPGHMVMWKGRGMMMRTYCLEVGRCNVGVILVNSPRWSIGKRVPSKTKGLEYTAFAARFETAMEEFALKTALRIL